MTFKPAQQGKYRPLVARAWRMHCEREGVSPNDKGARERWYREQLIDSAGVYTTKKLDHVRGFDTVMLHFAIIAGDKYWIEKLSHAAEDRLKYQIRRFLVDLSWLEKEDVTWEYVRGIYEQSRLPLTIDDCAAWQLWKVLQMLDTHIRRICKDYGLRPCELPTRAHPHKPFRVSIDPDNHHLHVGHDLDHDHHPERTHA